LLLCFLMATASQCRSIGTTADRLDNASLGTSY
jgi:hypothetical protein